MVEAGIFILGMTTGIIATLFAGLMYNFYRQIDDRSNKNDN